MKKFASTSILLLLALSDSTNSKKLRGIDNNIIPIDDNLIVESGFGNQKGGFHQNQKGGDIIIDDKNGIIDGGSIIDGVQSGFGTQKGGDIIIDDKNGIIDGGSIIDGVQSGFGTQKGGFHQNQKGGDIIIDDKNGIIDGGAAIIDDVQSGFGTQKGGFNQNQKGPIINDNVKYRGGY